ncbi:MAG: hypothetical protein J6B87_07635 [Clostridia bacterium]|nr:hypothetical protein [Clostridia bacterium]
MIFLYDVFIETEKDLELFIEEVQKATPVTADEDLKKSLNLYDEYLRDIFRLSLKLQESVTKNISDDLYTCVVIPSKDTDDFDSLNFLIAAEDDREIRKREMILFEKYCDKYFKSSIGLMSLFEMHFPD